ncbi:NUDIX domain-containing protein [Alkalihalobacillus alcalophilus]|nr:NUDIX domain-containing protein [Alkalihalobacillus alcalophilus]MED1563654.1 NUDIX domain-containing protein [Alkalihalobacillus alcalophilus]
MEYLQVFNDIREPVGIKSRDEVHRFGYWHETFHCWFVGEEADKPVIYFQLRSKLKQDYPELFDITAAGHLLAGETINDGIREVHEELGIEVKMEDLIPLGVLDYCATKENFIDKEIAHVFLYTFAGSWSDFDLQEEEVSGVYRAYLDDFENLCLKNENYLKVEGFERTVDGEMERIEQEVSLEQFVPHDQGFYQKLLQLIRLHI